MQTGQRICDRPAAKRGGTIIAARGEAKCRHGRSGLKDAPAADGAGGGEINAAATTIA